MTGKTILHYSIAEKLGHRGLGEIYKAEDTKLHRTVTLQFLPPERTCDEVARLHFMQEARAASALDHPNIGTHHEIEEHDGQLFVVMEYDAGGTLQKKIKNGPLTTDDAVFITQQIARGLSRAHARGIIHRDVNPASVALSEEGHVKIIDFGLYWLRGQKALTHPGTAADTGAYRSPEEARGEEVDHRSDLWALGVILYEMLTARLPFEGDTKQNMISSILNKEPVYPDECPLPLQSVLKKCLAKDPEDRYAHAHEIARDLSPPPTEGEPIPSLEDFVPERPQSLVYLLAGTTLVVLLALAWFFRPSDSEPQVRVALTPIEQQTFDDTLEINPQAYEAYLKGISHEQRDNPSDFLKSLDFFQQAVALEPEFGLAYLGIVRACTGLMKRGGGDYEELYPVAKAALNKAIALGGSLAVVYGTQGRFLHNAEWNGAGAEAAFLQSLELNPNLANTYYDYANFLISMDRGVAALSAINKGQALDPQSPHINKDVGWILYCLRRYDDAIQAYLHTLEMHPDFMIAHRELSRVYAKKGLFPEALQSIQQAVALDSSTYNLQQRALVLAMADQREEAGLLLDDLLSGPSSSSLSFYDLALTYAALGDLDEAYSWLEKSYAAHQGLPFFIKADPLAEAFHGDPRYEPFLLRFGLAP